MSILVRKIDVPCGPWWCAKALPCRLLLAAIMVVVVGACSEAADETPGGHDRFVVEVPEGFVDPGVDGRLVVFLARADDRRLRGLSPAQGPFYFAPAPIASIPVDSVPAGGSITLETDSAVMSEPFQELGGRFHVQAVLDVDGTQRSHLAGPGNAVSEVVNVELREGRADEVTLALVESIPEPADAQESAHLRWVRMRSEMLSAFYGRDVFHRAGVALPPEYEQREHTWPTVYVVPGFGGRDEGARTYAEMMSVPGIEAIAPMAVHVVLDPESPVGHHGFVDSPNHGPRERALVEEFIPYLESTFRLESRPEARVVTGHSSGGWASLWLQLQRPEVFGGCWASAPGPVDYTAFITVDLYADDNLYFDEGGRERAACRWPTDAYEGSEVVMTIRTECLMERAIDPHGASGQQWDTWESMFSARDPGTNRPRSLFDRDTGLIDREVADQWLRFDICRLVRDDWATYGPILTERVRVSCGEIDSYHLDRSVRRLAAMVEQHGATEADAPGYIRIVRDGTHDNLPNLIFQDVNREMREYFRQHGLAYGEESPR